MRRQGLMLACALLAAMPAAVWADAVQDSIEAARKAYEAGRYGEAVRELEFAAQMIRQKKAGMLRAVFPEPLPGWKAAPPRIQVAGRALLGGGVSASRAYTKGEARVTVEIAMNNPLLQTFLGIVDNPMFVGPDQQLVRVQGHRGLLKFDPAARSGELTIAHERKVLITIRGQGIASGDVLLAYGNRLDFGKLEEALLR